MAKDRDGFVFGGQCVYKNVSDTHNDVDTYLMRAAEEEFSLRRNKLVALLMLLGGDYPEGLHSVGIGTGIEFLQAFDINDWAGLKEFCK